MWLMENPYTIVLGGLALVVILIAGLLKTGRKSLLYAAVGVVVATIGLFVLERTTITPREEVRATLHLIAHELEQNNVEGVLAYVSDSLPKLKQEARSRMDEVEVTEVDIKRNLTIDIIEAKGMQIAEARFNCVIRAKVKRFSDTPQTLPRFFIVRFREDANGRWRVRNYEMNDPRQGLGT